MRAKIKSIIILVLTIISALVGCTIGAYTATRLYDMFGIWSCAIDIIVGLCLLGLLIFSVEKYMTSQTIDIIEPDEIDDEYK